MKRITQILILATILCLAFLGGQSLVAQGSAAAQGGGAGEQPSVATLQISLWPEYDRPEMLVIYRGVLAEDTPLPAALEIAMPADIEAPSAMAYLDETGQRLNQPYTSRVEGEARIVSFELPTLRFQMEYYDVLPVGPTGQRTYKFDFRADYDVENLVIEFQVPPTARNFVLEPAADSVVPETGSVVYHVVQAGALSQGETRGWTLSYDKDNSDLTETALGQAQGRATSALPTTTATGEANNSTGLVFVVAFVALVAVGAAAFWLGRRTGTEVAPAGQVPFPARKKRPQRGTAPGTFCHKCGAQLRPDADFCHKCGATVRQE
jgi:hypothetical protein